MINLFRLVLLVFNTCLIVLIGQNTMAQFTHNVGLFEYIEPTSDTSKLKYIKTFKCISKKNDDLVSLYRAIKYQAIDIGANCFKLKSFTKDEKGTITLTLDTYFGDNNFLNYNYSNHEKNIVFVISDGYFNNKSYKYKVNGKFYLLNSGEYSKHVISKNNKLSINKGGFTGTSGEFYWEENKPSIFLSLSKFGLKDNNYNNSFIRLSHTGGIRISTSRMKIIERNFGLLLTSILKEK